MNTPEILHFQVTERCNLACPGCYLPERAGKGASPELASRRVFEPLARAGVRQATLTGGEPLVHPKFIEICAEACRVFDGVQVVTNGLLLDVETFKRLRDAGVNSIRVSLDGAAPATHDKLRGLDGAFGRTVANLRAITALAEDERGGVDLGAIATLSPANVGEMAAIADLARDIGLGHLLVQPFHPFAMAYPPKGAPQPRPEASPEFLAKLDAQVAALGEIKAARPDFIDNGFEMLSALRDFHVRPGGPKQVCGADRFVFVNSLLQVRGCLFCQPLASLAEQTPDEVFSGKPWRDFQAFRRSCSLCLMGCQFRGKARRLADQGFALWNAGRREAAGRLFEASLKREKSVDALQGLGLSLKELGQPGRAEACFREVLAMRPAHPFALIDLGDCLRRQGRHQEAADVLGEAVRQGRGSARVRHQYGVALMALGRHGEALDQIMHAQRQMPGHAWVRFDVGMALCALGRAGEALEHFRAAMDLDPATPWFPYRLGLTLAGLGREAEALDHLARAVVVAPGEARPNLELGRLLGRMGRPGAQAYLREAARIDPGLFAREFPEGSADAF